MMVNIHGRTGHHVGPAVGLVHHHLHGACRRVVGYVDDQIAWVYVQSRVLEAIGRHKAKQRSAVRISPCLVREVDGQCAVVAEKAVRVVNNAARGGPGTRVGNGPNGSLRKGTDLRKKDLRENKDCQAQQKR